MSQDETLRALARKIGDGDIDACRRALAMLERGALPGHVAVIDWCVRELIGRELPQQASDRLRITLKRYATVHGWAVSLVERRDYPNEFTPGDEPDPMRFVRRCSALVTPHPFRRDPDVQCVRQDGHRGEHVALGVTGQRLLTDADPGALRCAFTLVAGPRCPSHARNNDAGTMFCFKHATHGSASCSPTCGGVRGHPGSCD